MKIAEQLMASDFLGIPVLLWICWMGTRVMLLGTEEVGGCYAVGVLCCWWEWRRAAEWRA